jgi:ATP-dependent DNA helicase RecG
MTARLDGILGAKAAGLLEDVFGIRTVGDLLRHYPRKYSQGMTVRGEDDELPEEGDHITFVGEIEKAEVRWTNRSPRREYLVISLSNRRPKVTATFFNAKFLKKQLVEGTRLMLSGEVGYFRSTMQLTHPAYLVLDSPAGRIGGTKSLRTIAETAHGGDGHLDMSAFERDFFPIYPASAKLQSWDIYACVRQVLDVLDPIPETLPESFVRQRSLISEDSALRAIHVGEKESERERARERLTFDEAVGLQWALAQRRHGEMAQSGPPAALRDDGLAAALKERLPFQLTAASARCSTSSPANWPLPSR